MCGFLRGKLSKNILSRHYLQWKQFYSYRRKIKLSTSHGNSKNTYRSNGYNRPQHLFHDIINRNPVSTSIIPHNITSTSKIYKKALNFKKSTDIFWKNSGPLTINYNPSLSNRKLNNVDVLLSDINTGYMLGWVSNNKISVNANINLEKYCICTWIDESNGTQKGKEKYMPGQDVELIRFVFAFNENSKLFRQKEYSYNRSQKKEILESCSRNNSNLLVDKPNVPYYAEIVTTDNMHCKINGIQY